MNTDKIKDIEFNYYIFFENNYFDETYQPIIPNNLQQSETMHLWDTELDSIIPALWYVLHLPRNVFDTIENNLEDILFNHDESHNIMVIPHTLIKNTNILNNPTLIICQDELYEKVIRANFNSKLGIYRVSELNTELLNEHYQKISEVSQKFFDNYVRVEVPFHFRLTITNERKIIPLIPLANQLGYTKQIMDEISILNNNNNSHKCTLQMRKVIHDCFKMIMERDVEFKNKYSKTFYESPIYNGVPLVITLPGIMGHQIKLQDRKKLLPNNEKEIIEILGIHRATAKNALLFEMDNISQELFTELNILEEHCKDSGPKQYQIDNHFIWRTLKKIGKLLADEFGKFGVDIIKNISQITVFSDFPIGLAILPGCSAPLCCIKEISYRPLTPLTRAFQYEISKSPQVYFGKKLKIIVAECVAKDDKIRPFCDVLTKFLNNLMLNEQDVEIVIEEIETIDQFKKFTKKNSNANILLVSAHGHYDVDTNMASLVIGKNYWMANDDDLFVPPVVLLSACHVMPRGRGVVCVGDMFMRAGANAVLGSFIPVDVIRNAVLFVRLFTNMIEVRKGWSNMRTLDQIWCHTVCTNAIHEILSSNETLNKWSNQKNKNGIIPIFEFKNNYANGKLRSTHVYEDSEVVLKQIALKDGKKEYIENFIKSNSYFPESIFYQFVGYPENVFIRNDLFEKVL